MIFQNKSESVIELSVSHLIVDSRPSGPGGLKHDEVRSGVLWMLPILDHVDQHLLAELGQVVGLPPVKVEVTESGTLEVADLAVERFDLVVDAEDVLLEARLEVEGFVAMIALQGLLGVLVGDVTLESQPGVEGQTTL